jgi:hypothetical protein
MEAELEAVCVRGYLWSLHAEGRVLQELSKMKQSNVYHVRLWSPTVFIFLGPSWLQCKV